MSDENCCGACGYPIHTTKDKACDWCRQTADRIDALTAENERLERVVKDISDEADLEEQEACMLEDDFIKAEKEVEALTVKLNKAVEALRLIEADCEADYPPSHLAIKYAARSTLAEIDGTNAP
jgi:hypothetical protein